MAPCLICCQVCAPQPPEGEGNTTFDLLGSQLKAVFVLRELLRLPPEKLTEFLERSGGDNPHEWISFCGACQELVEQAFSLFEQMVQVNRKYKKVQQQVIQKVRESDNRGEDAVATETRDFVKSHDYGPFESRFLVGDWEAEWRVLTEETAAPGNPVVKEEVLDQPEEEFDSDGGGGDNDFLDPCSDEEEETETRVEEKKRGNPGKNGRFQCPLCPRRYTCKGNRWQHVQRRHKGQTHILKYVDNEKPTPCPICQKVCKGRKGLTFHKRVHSERSPRPRKEQGGSCPVCTTYFCTNKQLNRHKRYNRCKPGVPSCRRGQGLESEKFVDEATGQTMFRCSVENCGKTYTLPTSMRSHMKRHQNLFKRMSEEKQYKWLSCGFCQDKFMGQHGLSIHQRHKHPEMLKPLDPSGEGAYPCPSCPLKFQNHMQKYRHIQKQHRDPPPKTDGDEGGGKEWRKYARQCPHCPYTGTKIGLEAHLKRVHEGGQYPLHCEHCGQGSVNPQNLKLHQAKEHFICGVRGCGLRLESQEQLHQHQLGVHGGEVNLFRCEDCGKFWTTRRRRERHQAQVHREKGTEQHICDQCGKTFPLREYLQCHVWNVHKKRGKSKAKSEKSSDLKLENSGLL